MVNRTSKSLTKHLLWLLLIFGFVPLSPANSATVTSLFDDFESESAVLNYNMFANWTVTNGTVDTVLGTVFDCQGSMICVDLDGSSNDAGELTTSNNFAAGIYTLSFDISGNQRLGSDTLTVTFGDLNEDFTLLFNDPWMTITRIVNASSMDFLTFSNAGGDSVGILLDNVSVSLIPIPPAVWLFASALGFFGLIGKRKIL